MDKKDNQNNISINFGIASFEIKKYDFQEPEEELDMQNLGYGVQFKPEVNLKEGTFSIEFKVTGQIGKEDPLKLGYIQTITTYRLSDIDELIDEDGNLVVPKGLAITLLSIALSTTRGALAAKTEGTNLAKAILPLVDPKEMYEASPLKGSIKI